MACDWNFKMPPMYSAHVRRHSCRSGVSEKERRTSCDAGPSKGWGMQHCHWFGSSSAYRRAVRCHSQPFPLAAPLSTSANDFAIRVLLARLFPLLNYRALIPSRQITSTYRKINFSPQVLCHVFAARLWNLIWPPSDTKTAPKLIKNDEAPRSEHIGLPPHVNDGAGGPSGDAWNRIKLDRGNITRARARSINPLFERSQITSVIRGIAKRRLGEDRAAINHIGHSRYARQRPAARSHAHVCGGVQSRAACSRSRARIYCCLASTSAAGAREPNVHTSKRRREGQHAPNDGVNHWGLICPLLPAAFALPGYGRIFAANNALNNAGWHSAWLSTTRLFVMRTFCEPRRALRSPNYAFRLFRSCEYCLRYRASSPLILTTQGSLAPPPNASAGLILSRSCFILIFCATRAEIINNNSRILLLLFLIHISTRYADTFAE